MDWEVVEPPTWQEKPFVASRLARTLLVLRWETIKSMMQPFPCSGAFRLTAVFWMLSLVGGGLALGRLFCR